MKTTHYLIILLLLPFFAHSQAGTWTWMKGDSTTGNHGNYGTMGVPSATNEPPAAYAAAYWTDTAGNFWFYGGSDTLGANGSLWRFNPETVIWTWMNGNDGDAVFASAKGVFDADNEPGNLSFDMLTWVDKKNHLWMYGGYLSTNTEGSALWQYDPAINQWAWMTGPEDTAVYGTKGVEDVANTPGARDEVRTAWTDSVGNLWFFSGWDEVAGQHNDMWRYNISNGLWTWMSGTKLTENTGAYGPLDSASVNYYPSARAGNIHWQDSTGAFWMIGGINFYSFDYNKYNDVWKFTPKDLKWKRVKGTSASDETDVAASTCVANNANKEAGRFENSATWKVCENIIINYGGIEGYDYFSNGYSMSDLWAFLPQQKQWLKISDGANAGQYGTQGVASAQNWPPARAGSCSFIDKHHNLWLFGGSNFDDANPVALRYNDMWKYVPDPACFGSSYCVQTCNLTAPVLTVDDSVICPGDSAYICAPSGFSTYAWSNSNSTACIKASTGSYYVTVTDGTGCTATSNHVNITAHTAPSVTISPADTTVCSGTNAQICAPAGFASYSWNSTGSSRCTEAQLAGSYYVTVTDNNGCTAVSNHAAVHVFFNTPVVITVSNDTLCPGDSAQLCAPNGETHYHWNTNDTTKCIEAKTTGDYSATVIDGNGCTSQSTPTHIVVLQPAPVTIFKIADTLRVYNVTVIQWYLNNNPIPNATTNNWIASGAGTYTVQVTDTNGCSVLSSPFVITGMESIAGSEDISIYPNPLSAGNYQLATSNNLVGAQIEILDNSGRVIYRSEIKNTHTEISSQFASGVYLLRITSGNTIITRKLVKL